MFFGPNGLDTEGIRGRRSGSCLVRPVSGRGPLWGGMARAAAQIAADVERRTTVLADAHRRDVVRGALTDTRGARGCARAVRDAARAGAEISQAVLAGIRPVHLEQIALFPDLVDDGR